MEFETVLSNGNKVNFRKFLNSKGVSRLNMTDMKADNVSVFESELSDEADVLDTIASETNYKKELCNEILSHFKSLSK